MDESKKLLELKKKYLQKELPELAYPETPIEVSEDSFYSLIEKYRLLVVDCWAPWCAPCKALAPIIESLAKELKGKVVFAKLNVDKNKAIASAFDVMNIPTLLVFKNGKLIDRLVGVYSRDLLLSKIRRWVDEPV